ncbi:restriction endonuclease [Sanguibacter sp. HDW7]|uniref:restriction endonuclease n=1 Tax=Sanguibacter sp. HDW7 TaxID=2714931 RepID=UPI0014084B3E|nr:restriction endonuclease [Sanguibacter sp. HDW7]QIK82424.1 hypothetical protein G7063_01435 [Sanguibacter sp. HDW7]
MPPNHYRAGADFEREVRAHLIRHGYEVIRSAGSKTKVDLLAFKTGQVLVIQCKRNGSLPPAERVEVRRIAALIPTALPLLAARPGITFNMLTGDGPHDRTPWAPDPKETP